MKRLLFLFLLLLLSSGTQAQQENHVVIDSLVEVLEFTEEVDTSMIEHADIYQIPMMNENKQIDKISLQKALRGCSNALIVQNFARLQENDSFLKYKIPSISPLNIKYSPRSLSGFGYRIHPRYHDYRFHAGIDLVASSAMQAVHATAQGIVSKIAYDPKGYGLYIIVEHAYGYRTIYAHLEYTTVQIEQEVFSGTILGKMGRTGNATGYHLHYGIMKNNHYVDPYPMLTLYYTPTVLSEN